MNDYIIFAIRCIFISIEAFLLYIFGLIYIKWWHDL